MFRYGLFIALVAVIGGFAAAGYMVKEASVLDPRSPQQAAQSLAAWLQSIPSPLPASPLPASPLLESAAAAGTGQSRAQQYAKDAAQALATLAPPGATTGAGPADTPNLLQLAARALAVQMQTGNDPIAASVVATATSNDSDGPSRAQVAGQTVALWLNAVSGGTLSSASQTAALQPAPAPVVPSLAVTVEAPAAIVPTAPAAPVATVDRSPPAPDTAAATNQAPVVVAQTAPATAQQSSPPASPPASPQLVDSKAVEPAIDQATKDQAGSMADSLSKGFGDLLKTLSGSEPQPDANAPADSAKPATPPADLAATPNEHGPLATRFPSRRQLHA